LLSLLATSQGTSSLTDEEKEALELIRKKKQEWGNIRKEQEAE